MDKPQIDTNNEELRKKLLDVNLIREHKYTPNNVVLVTLDDVIEIFHELIPYTMTKLDELESRDQQIALAARIKELRRAKMQGYISADLVHKVDRRIATLKAREKS